jgi:hypothetical protein
MICAAVWSNVACCSPAQDALAAWFKPHVLPALEERVAKLREVRPQPLPSLFFKLTYTLMRDIIWLAAGGRRAARSVWRPRWRRRGRSGALRGRLRAPHHGALPGCARMYQRWLAGWRRCGCARVRINRQSRGRTGFRDHAVYRGRQVYFYKRAQILVADLWAALGRPAAGVCVHARRRRRCWLAGRGCGSRDCPTSRVWRRGRQRARLRLPRH